MSGKGASLPATRLMSDQEIVCLLVLAESVGQQLLNGIERCGSIGPLGRNREGSSLSCAERQQPHDRTAADRFTATGDGHFGIESIDRLNELCGSAGVQALLVDDRELTNEGVALGAGRLGQRTTTCRRGRGRRR